jgi:transcriptional regulator with XRE-family HTH domain
MDLIEIGGALRQARIDQGLGIDDVERDIKIRKKFITALEEGDSASLPGEVYARGFLKNYAEYLGIDPHEMLDAYREAHPLDSDEFKFKKQELLSFNTAPPKKLINWKFVIFAIVAVLFVAVIAYYFKDSFQSKPGNEAEEQTDIQTQYSTSPIAGDAREDDLIPADGELSEQIKFIVSGERCYVDIKVDGANIYRGMFERGEEKEYTYKSSVSIRTNDAGSITVIANGANIGVVGPQGELVTKEYRVD